MKLKTIDDNNNITLKYYSEAQCKEIFTERNSYVLRFERSYGEDYGGSHCTDEHEITYDNIIAERVLVKDGHFYGALILTDYERYNGGSSSDRYGEEILVADAEKPNHATVGFNFSYNDHDRWDYSYIYIQRVEDVE